MKKEKCYIGIDIGGTKIKYILRKDNKILLESSYNTSSIKTQEDLKAVLEKIIGDCRLHEQRADISHVGIGSKGRVLKDETIDYSDSFPLLNNLNLKELIEKEHAIKVKIVNDASLPYYAIKEKVKDKNILIATLGTGLGTSIFKKGKKLGDESFSSDFAHGKYKKKEREDFVSTKFLLNMAKKAKIKVSTPFELYEISQNLSPENKSKSEKAKKIFEEYGENLGEILSHLTNEHKIDEIYLSGGITGAENLFFPNMKKSLKKHSKTKTKIPQIKIIKLKHEVGAFGASKLFE